MKSKIRVTFQPQNHTAIYQCPCGRALTLSLTGSARQDIKISSRQRSASTTKAPLISSTSPPDSPGPHRRRGWQTAKTSERFSTTEPKESSSSPSSPTDSPSSLASQVPGSETSDGSASISPSESSLGSGFMAPPDSVISIGSDPSEGAGSADIWALWWEPRTRSSRPVESASNEPSKSKD